MRVPIAPAMRGKRPTARKIEQVLPETMAVVRGSEHSDAKRFLILHIGSPLSRRLSRLPPSGRDYEQTTFRISASGITSCAG